MLHLASSGSSSTLSEFTADQVQPNAIDLRVDKIFQSFTQPFIISEDKKEHRKSNLIEPDKDGWWRLDPGSYEIIMEGVVSLGDDEAGWVITRSSLNRNGCFLTSGLYDSGYSGVMAGVLHVNNGPMLVQRGTRVGQFLLFKAESLHQYDGSYGAGKAHDERYAQ